MMLTALPTGQDVAAFVGQGENPEFIALADQQVPIITAMARAYTRDKGFEADLVEEDLAAVIITATARLMANPDQVNYRSGSVSFQSHFTGWSLAETFVLNRYRKRAT